VNFSLLKVNLPPQMMTSMRTRRKLPSVLHPAPNLAMSRILTRTTRDEPAKEASDDDVSENDDMQDDVHSSSSGSTHDNDKIHNPDVDNFCNADNKVESASSPPFNHDGDDSKEVFESASSQPSDHDGDDSEEDVDVNDVHKQRAHSISSNETPVKDKTTQPNNRDDDSDDDDDTDGEEYAGSSKTSPKSWTHILFTTGLGVTTEKQSELRTVVESAASKDEFSQAFKPGKDLYCLVFWWARKPPHHFAADILNYNAVVAREADLTWPFHLCQVRGWILTCGNSNSNVFHIQYKRFHECLTNAKLPADHKALNLNGMIQKVYQELDTCVLPSPAPIDQSVTTKTKANKSKGNIQSAAKKRKKSTASSNFELIPHSTYLHHFPVFFFHFSPLLVDCIALSFLSPQIG
jgi:hypothetical protein